MTFEGAAHEWHGHRLDALDAGHAARLLTRLQRDAFPILGKLTLPVITPTDVLAMVRRVETRGAFYVSRRLKQHVSRIYRLTIPQGWAERDPAEHLAQLLKPKPRTRHVPRIGRSELPELIRAIDGHETLRRRAVTRAALLVTLLTQARTNETRHASWDKFENLEGPAPL